MNNPEKIPTVISIVYIISDPKGIVGIFSSLHKANAAVQKHYSSKFFGYEVEFEGFVEKYPDDLPDYYVGYLFKVPPVGSKIPVMRLSAERYSMNRMIIDNSLDSS